MTRHSLIALAILAAFAVSSARAATSAPSGATARIMDGMGRQVGSAQFSTLPSGAVQVTVSVAGFDPIGGDHGLHVHAVGKCEAPAFTSAGGHLNLTGKQHGLANPAGPHSGDLPNIQFYPDGSGALTASTTAFTLASLLDADGSAIVIHAAPDDLLTDPSGNSGARIGCGVIVADGAAAPSAALTTASTARTTSTTSATSSALPAAATAPKAAASKTPMAATAAIADAMGRQVGSAQFSTLPSGAVQVSVTVAGFDPVGGDHGLHVHAVGKCEAPAFTSAGGHLNLTGKQHGLANPAGPHSGDLPNIQFYPDGSGALTASTTAFTLASLLDADGSAIVIHAAPDDLLTDPSGTSGARIGCGVIVAGSSAQP